MVHDHDLGTIEAKINARVAELIRHVGKPNPYSLDNAPMGRDFIIRTVQSEYGASAARVVKITVH
jgi:hypothetical protein